MEEFITGLFNLDSSSSEDSQGFLKDKAFRLSIAKTTQNSTNTEDSDIVMENVEKQTLTQAPVANGSNADAEATNISMREVPTRTRITQTQKLQT